MIIKCNASKLVKYVSGLLIGIFTLTGCSAEDSVQILSEDDLQLKIIYSNDFEIEDELNMKRANWANGGMFGCDFDKDNITIEDGEMTLNLTYASENSHYEYGYSGAEYRTCAEYGYGYYSVVMKPAKNDGTVSSFFIYHRDEDGSNSDEIDIEFLGKDTTVVQFNYYVDGVGNHDYIYELGFDASEEYHQYGFLWDEEGIIWFVDGKGVYGVDGTKTEMPDTPGKVMMNLWNCVNTDKMIGWLNEYDGTVGLQAHYQSFYIAEIE